MVSDGTSTTVDEYLAALDPARRPVVSAIRQLVVDNLPTGYQETMAWGMPSYVVPLERYPDTYNGQPLKGATVTFWPLVPDSSTSCLAFFTSGADHFVPGSLV